MSYVGGYLGGYLGDYLGGVGAVAIESAFATTTNTVRVILSLEPLAQDPFETGDALNAATWTITDLTTGQVYTSVSVAQVDDVTFDVSVLEQIGSHLDVLEVEAPGLLDSGGLPIPDVGTFSFPGCTQTLDP